MNLFMNGLDDAPSLTKADLMKVGFKLWHYLVGLGATPGKITGMTVKTMYEEAATKALDHPAPRPIPTKPFLLLHTLLTQAEGMVTAIGLTQWIDCGLPQIELGHKFAASLLVTDVSPDALEMVKHPWRAFIIEVPDGLLQIYDNTPEGKQDYVSVRRLLVTKLDGHPHGEWGYVAYCASSVSMWRLGVSAKDLLPPVLEGQDITVDGRENMLLDQTDQDRRVSTLIGRLIINVCLAMTIPDLTKEHGPGHVSWAKAKQDPAKMPEGQLRSFRLGAPVVVDLRDRVRSFIRGERSSPDVRSLVRGHFKRQHYGAGNAMVKIIWREPFWRGEENLPIVIRPHVIKAE